MPKWGPYRGAGELPELVIHAGRVSPAVVVASQWGDRLLDSPVPSFTPSSVCHALFWLLLIVKRHIVLRVGY